jgi:hypothetical protein
MTDKLPPPVMLTAKQAKFVECIAKGMLSKDAYRVAYDSDVDDKQAGVRAAEVKRSKSVAVALREVLRSRRLQDLDSIGELISDTKEDRLAAKESGAHAAVAAFDRMRGNWLGVEKTTIQLDPVQMLSDEELIHRLAGDDPERIEAARKLLGAPEGFPDAVEADFEESSPPGSYQP